MDEIPDISSGHRSLSARALRWCFKRRNQRRILLGIAVLGTLLAIIYARVNWHGKQVWDNCKREMSARGEVWDWSVYAPAPVPDDENIFKAPKMAEWFGDNRGIMDTPLEQWVTNSFARRFSNPDSTKDIKTGTAASNYLAWSEQFQGDFDIIAAALKRPSARLVADYAKPFSITFPNLATLHGVVKTLVQRANCHLIVGQPEKASSELALLHDLGRMVEGQGKFITTEGAWMRRELTRHSLQVIAKGLELHGWAEPQLAALQEQLKNSDCIALYADALKCGRALILSSLDSGDFSKSLFQASGGNFWTRLSKHPELLLIMLAPRGSTYEHAASISVNFRNMTGALTPADGIIHPAKASKAFASWKRAQEGLPSLLRIQTLINEARIACALERYHLAHGTYPETLDILVPQFINQLPRDIVNGEPLRYRRTEDGIFLLYSVGWNETDDGGKIGSTKNEPNNATQGDWVWKNSLKPE